VKRDLPSPAEYHLYSLVLYTLRLRLATPSTKGESSVACMLRHVLRNILLTQGPVYLKDPLCNWWYYVPWLMFVSSHMIFHVTCFGQEFRKNLLS
jgi:hypothetical protein